MKSWIVAKTHFRGFACVHGLTEENRHIRLLQPNGAYPSTHTRFEVGQIWDLELAPSSRLVSPQIENVIVTRWKQLGSEPALREVLLERVNPWRGGPDQLFGGYLRSVMNTNNAFISERDAFSPGSIGYWLPDAPLIKWSGTEDRFCYRYFTPDRELITDYTGFTPTPCRFLCTGRAFSREDFEIKIQA